MKIGFCYNLRDDFEWVDGGPADQWGDWDVGETVNHIRRVLEQLGHLVIDLSPDQIIGCKVRFGIDSILSICEMTGGSFRESIVASLCELERVPYLFSAPDALHNTLDKNVANFLAMQSNLPVPAWINIEPGAVFRPKLIEHMSFPLILKPSAEGSGMGMSHQRTISHCIEDVVKQVDVLQKDYQSGTLIQEFVSGREFTIGVVDVDGACKALHPIEVLPRTPMDNFIYNFEAKENSERLVEFSPLSDEPQILEEIQNAARVAHTKFQCREVSRIDFRFDVSGVLHFIEINALPHLHPEIGDFCRSVAAAGYDYEELWCMILQAFDERVVTKYDL